jgi:tetratricopeptide (TPR) repeat protein
MQVNLVAAYLYLSLLAAGLAVLLSVVTVLPRLWYVAAMAIFIGWLAVSKLDLLQVFGLGNNTPFIAVLALILPVSYYFHAFRPDVSFARRLLVFTSLLAIVILAAGYFATVRFPVLSVLGYGATVPLALSILFIIAVAPEIVRGFVHLVSRGGGGNSLLHFTLLTAIYLLNLLLRFFHNTGRIDWDFFYVNAFAVLAVSVVLGVWGFRERAPLLSRIIADPYASFLYIGLAVITVATVGYAFATGNDPMVEMFEDVILFSHIAMGLAFFLYVLINFRMPLQRGMAVHKVLFQPRQFPFGFAWGVGGMIMLSFGMESNLFPYYQGVAGYNNGIGDAYYAQGDATLAESYYQLALQYEYRNHKSNYAVASMAMQQGNGVKAAEHLRQALLKQPQPYTYAKLSNLYLRENLFFESMFALKEGVKTFPENGELLNNLALLYGRTSVLDSAYLYYQQAARFTHRPEVVQANLLAFWVKAPQVFSIDSLLRETPPSDYVSYENNRLLLATLAGKADEQPLAPAVARDSALSRERFAYVFNYAINHKGQADTALLGTLRGYQGHGANILFNNDLLLAEAYLQYYGNDRAAGLELLNGLQAGSEQRGAFYNELLGMWHLQNEAPQLAVRHFERSVALGDTTMRTNLGLSLAEAGRWNESLAIWQAEQYSPNPQARTVARRRLGVTRVLTGAADSLDDAAKVALVHLGQNNPRAAVPATIGDAGYRGLAYAALAGHYLKANQVPPAEEAYRAAAQAGPGTSAVRELALRLLAAKGQYPQLLQALNDSLPTDEARDRQPYWEALAYEHTGKVAAAAKSYAQALRRLPLSAEVVTRAAAFYGTRQKDNDRAYNVLVEALRLNPYAPVVHRAYIRQALTMGLVEYAEKGLEEFKTVATPADYAAFLPEYEAKKALVEKSLTEWE